MLSFNAATAVEYVSAAELELSLRGSVPHSFVMEILDKACRDLEETVAAKSLINFQCASSQANQAGRRGRKP